MELVKVFCFSLISSSSCCCCTLVIESRAVADGCIYNLGYKRFYRRTLLETSDFLKDDCLIINCKVGVVVSEVQCPPTFTLYSRVPVSELGSHFGVLLDSMEGSDIMSVFMLCSFQTFDLLKLPDIYETLIVKLLAAADKYKATELKSVCLKFTAENLAAVLETDGYQQQKDECLSLQSELLKAVAGYEESSHSIGGAKSLSVWAQLSDGGGGGDTSSRHVRQRTT
ncbi:hypothetical protein DY000_02018294 [Brassica cretica]|uniref:BPM/SPOP BACK domain-containing protein n=1 Tax=Brassica cretica TaxID=69181 RepID=A0ABQ7CXB5_BRACR|nr:hypothetical protein DY000_02018294 [Brassica cretica]